MALAESAEPGRVIGVDKSSGILVKTGDGVLALTQLQLQSKRAMDWKSFINGNPRFITSVLGAQENQ
jgi:methionyl-tRNA formyltransferase